MKRIKDLKIGFRLNFFLGLTIAVLLTALGFYIVNKEKNKILEDTDIRMTEQVQDLSELIENQISLNQNKVNSDIKVAHHYFYTLGDLTETTETVNYLAINQSSNSSSSVKVPKWEINGIQVQKNTEIVYKLQELTNSTA
ncbi:MAG: hypothetical protein C0599_13105, partial [Salinivirgaceae bacterium]